MSAAHQKIRHDDFLRRVADDPEGVYHHGTSGWRYIPVNAFADETALLARLTLTPESCQACDAWWEVAKDQCFVSVRTKKAVDLAPGLYARNRGHAAEFIDLLAVVEDFVIDRATFEKALMAFVKLGFPTDRRFGLNASRVFQPVEDGV